MGLFSKTIGIDLGTVNTLIFTKRSGIALNEPSLVAVDKYEGRVVSTGNAANDEIGKTPNNIVAIRPLKDGVIADFDITQTMIRSFMKQARVGGILKPRIVACVPSGVTEVERRAAEEVMITSGAKSVMLIEELLVAAIGAGIYISDATGNMIVDIGGGTCEAAVLSLGGIVTAKSVRVGGEALNGAIIKYIKKEHSLNVGDKMAEEIKIEIGNAYPDEKVTSMEVRGRDVSTGLPKQCTVTSDEIRKAMSENFDRMLDVIKATIENTPPELVSDIIENGIYLSGGGALIKGMDKLISETLKIPVHIVENPLECVVRGIGKYLKNNSNVK